MSGLWAFASGCFLLPVSKDTPPVDTGAPSETPPTEDVVESDSGTPSVTPPSSPPGSLVPPPQIAKESSWCWFVVPDLRPSGAALGVWVVGMDSGEMATVGSWGSVYEYFHGPGLAYTGTTLVMSGYTGSGFQWAELDLVTGSLRTGPESTESTDNAVTWDGAALVVPELFGTLTLHQYADFDGLVADTPIGEVALDEALLNRLHVTNGLVYGALGVATEVQIHDYASGALTDTIALEAWDATVYGMSVAGGYLHLLDGSAPPRIGRFDLTGAHLGDVPLVAREGWSSAGPSGLVCEAP